VHLAARAQQLQAPAPLRHRRTPPPVLPHARAHRAARPTDVVKGASDDQLYVIKRVRCIPCKTKEEQLALAYAVQESRLLMQLRHPNIVRVKDFFTEGEDHCIVLAYCAGGDLKQQIDAAANGRRGLEPASILGWMAGIASAAHYFHRDGVVHRDLKPANVFLTALDGRAGDVRVGDFGSARLLHSGQGSIRAKLTGSKHYMVMTPKVVFQQTKLHDGELTEAFALCRRPRCATSSRTTRAQMCGAWGLSSSIS
jgi:serine/threonine protein kinase